MFETKSWIERIPTSTHTYFIFNVLLLLVLQYHSIILYENPNETLLMNAADTIEDIKRWDNRIRLAKKGGWDTRIRLAKKLVSDWDKRIRLAKKSRLRLMKKDWDTRIRLAKKSSLSSGQEDYDAYQPNAEGDSDEKRNGHIRLI